jgi:hypothetical protein
MSEPRVKVFDAIEFDEREWLRREVLWASLMTPYGAQMAGWFNGTQVSQHMGNFSRATLFTEADLGIEGQSKTILNQGKNIGGIISSATLFRINPTEAELQELYTEDRPTTIDTLKVQARNIDIALGNIAVNYIAPTDDDSEAYTQCERLSTRAYKLQNTFAQRRLLLRAGKIMSGLARREIAKWREMTAQNKDQPLPILTIPDGGMPRSAGPRVDRLQPIFHQIVNTDQYQALKK